jgi:hypothetical protein
MSKFNNRWTWSNLCQRKFQPKLEAERAEYLTFRQMAGEISDLKFQAPIVISKDPSVKLIVDFSYIENGELIYDDAKGYLKEETRIKLAWLKEKGIEVRLSR